MPAAYQALRSNVPPLSKVWNRDYAVHRLTAELARARQLPGYTFSILLVQLDGLSLARQDRLGFALAADIGPQVFSVLTDGLLDSDACCHLANDEFLLILPERTKAESRALAARLREKWSSRPDSREATVALRAGWASSPANGSSVEQLFAAADECLARGRDDQDWDPALVIPAFETTATRAPAQPHVLVGPR